MKGVNSTGKQRVSSWKKVILEHKNRRRYCSKKSNLDDVKENIKRRKENQLRIIPKKKG
jgi:hypothetical protein